MYIKKSIVYKSCYDEVINYFLHFILFRMEANDKVKSNKIEKKTRRAS